MSIPRSFRRIALFCWLFSLAAPSTGVSQDPITGGSIDTSKVSVVGIIRTNPHVPSEILFGDRDLGMQHLTDYTIPRFHALLAADPTPRVVVLQLNQSSFEDPTLQVGAFPALADSALDNLRRAIQATDISEIPRTKVGRVAMAITFLVNGGLEFKFEDLQPPVDFPGVNLESYTGDRELSLSVDALKRWSRQDVLPVLVGIATCADPKFRGVRGLGQALDTALVGDSIDWRALTERSESYWQAVMEMGRGNELPTTILIFLLISQGELDRASFLTSLILRFCEDETVPRWYLSSLRQYLDKFEEKLHRQIMSGISHYDVGDFNSAQAIYERILAEYPRSAWTVHELALALQSTPGPDQLQRAMELGQRKVECDPFYASMSSQSTGIGAFRMGRRMEIQQLFHSDDSLWYDYARFAVIAEDLGEFGTAAWAYWKLRIFGVEAMQESYLDRFICCLRQLGLRDAERNFKGNFDEACSRIAAEREKRMIEHPMYQMMAKPK